MAPETPAAAISSRLARHLPLVVVLAVWLGALLAWRSWLGRPLYALSHDDVLRIALAAAVAPDNLLPSDLWPPLQAWLTALALQIAPDVRTTPGAVNVLCAVATLVGTYVLAGRIGLEGRGRLLAVALLATLPWWNLLALSALAEPMATCAFVWALVGLVDAARGEVRGAWLAAAAAALGGMVRYEAWGVGLLVGVTTLPVSRRWLSLPPLDGPRRSWLGPALLPWAFPAAWMALEWRWNGDPLYFANVARENLVGDAGTAALPAHAPLDLLVAVGPVLLLAGLALMRARRTGPVEPGLRVLLLVSVLGVLAQMAAQMLALAGTHNTPRHYVAWAPGLAVLAAWGCAMVAERRGRWAAGLVVAVPVILGFALVREVPDAVEAPVAQVASRIAAVRAGGTLGAHDRVMIEAAPWECFALQVALADVRPGQAEGLDAVEWDRDPFAALGAQETLADRMEHPSRLAQAEDALREDLSRARVGLLVTATPRGASLAERVATPAGGAGAWRIWRVGERSAAAEQGDGEEARE